jgi:6-phosphogluconolactonase
MKRLAGLVLLLACSATVRADTYAYVSVAGDKRIAVYRLDPTDGKLTHLTDAATEGEPGFLTTDPKKELLIAAIRSAGTMSSFRIDGKTGKLTHVNTVPGGPDPAHVATDRTGRFLLTAFYVDAKVTVHAIAKDGALSDKPVQSVPTAEKAHAVLLDRSNRFLFVPHTGPNAIFQFKFDPETGKLTANTPPRIETGDHTGPRHIVWHPTKEIAYVDNEQGSSITAYALDAKAGTLKALQTLSTLPKDFKELNSCAEIRIHPTGKFVYVANRGHDSLAIFKIDAEGGLTAGGQEPTEKTPRSFDVDSSGKYLVAAGEDSGKLAVYRIDALTGALKRLHTYEAGKMPWCVMLVDLPEDGARLRFRGQQRSSPHLKNRTASGQAPGRRGPPFPRRGPPERCRRDRRTAGRPDSPHTLSGGRKTILPP